MSSLYCIDHISIVDSIVESLAGECPGEWLKVVDGCAKGDYFCDECSKPIFVGQKARYTIFLAEGLRDPMKEDRIFSPAEKLETKRINLD